jgi:hypothetical protein
MTEPDRLLAQPGTVPELERAIEEMHATLAVHEDRLQRLERGPPILPPPEPISRGAVRDLLEAVPGLIVLLMIGTVFLVVAGAIGIGLNELLHWLAGT